MKRNSWHAGMLALIAVFSCTANANTLGNSPGDPFFTLNDARGGGMTDLDRIQVHGHYVSRTATHPGTSLGLSVGGSWEPYFQVASGDGGQFFADEGAPEDPNPNQCGKGNPILPATRNKVETEIDFSTSGEMPLTLSRTYNLNWYGRGIFGGKWTSTFDYRLVLDTGWNCYPRQGGGSCGIANGTEINAVRPNGITVRYTKNALDGVFYEDKPGPVSRIIRQPDGTFSLSREDGGTETYNAHGYIQTVRSAQGIGWTYSYSGTFPTRITHTSGRYVGFTWNGLHLVAVRDPAGNVHHYSYKNWLDQFPDTGYHQLMSHVQPAAAPVTTTYHYENHTYLSGKSINGLRYSTFSYNEIGYPISTEHGGQNLYRFKYEIGVDNIWRVEETNPLGKKSRYEFRGGKLLSTVGEPSQHCGATASARTYDAYGYPDIEVDFNGNTIDYDHNARGQLLRIVEAADSPAQRIRTFVWDNPENRLLSETVEGQQRTNYSYTTDNRIASIRVTNLSPHGVPAQVRETTFHYTYHSNGMLASVTENGPIAGNLDAITTTFNALGDIVSLSNGAGHATLYGAHTGLGSPGRIEGANGDVTEFTYGPGEELLNQRTYVGAQAGDTAMTYANGLLSSVMSMDGVRVSYQYDAHRRPIASFSRAPSGDYRVQQITYNPMSLPVRITISRSAYPPDTHIVGTIDGVFAAPGGGYEVSGWACSSGYDGSIAVHMYLGGAAGSSPHGFAYMADVASEPQVAAACGTNGTAHRFKIPIDTQMRSLHGGKTIFIHGISPAGHDNSLISGSGQAVVPPMPPPPIAVDNAELVAQSVPSIMERGQNYNVSVTLRNIGNTTWATATGMYSLGAINDNTFWGTHRVALPHAVSPGEVVTFNWVVTPHEAGLREFHWRMVNDGVAWFGAASENIQVIVWAPEPPVLPPPYEPCGPDVPGCYQIPTSHPMPSDFVERFVERSTQLARREAPASRMQSTRIQLAMSSSAVPTIESQTFIDYDELGRVRARRGNNGQHLTYTYDANGNVQTTKDSLGRLTSFAYDALNRLVHTTDAAGGNAYFAYDTLDRMLRAVDPRGNATMYVYDGFGQLWATNSPDTGTTTYQFDGAGLLTQRTRNDGSWLQYEYDGLGRQTRVNDQVTARTYTYDLCQNGKGRLCAADYPGGTRHFGYTPQGQVSVTRDWTPTSEDWTGYSFDAMGRLTGVSYPGGTNVGYGYEAGELRTIRATINGVARDVVRDMRYSASGQLTRLVYGHGLPKDREYDLDGRLRVTHDHAFLGHTYHYNAVDEVVSIENWSRPHYNQNFAYDSLSRLTGIDSPAGQQDFTFDANGNRTFHRWLSHEPYSVDPGSNRLLSTDHHLTYDGRGNRLTKSWGGSTETYQYDAFNRLSSVSRDHAVSNANPNYVTATYPAGTTTYTVNALGQRTAKSGPLGSSRFVYFGQNTLMTEFNNGQPTDYIWMGSEPIGLVRGGQLYFTHSDRLGRPEVVSDQSGNSRWIAANYAYDRAVVGNSLGDYNLGLPGQYFDAETGFWYNGFRDYDGRTGRYLQSDPIGLKGGLNTFAYVNGNPVSNVDFYGLQSSRAATIASPPPGYMGIEEGGPRIYVTPVALNFLRLATIMSPFGPAVIAQLNSKDDGSESKPDNCPTGTLPIDKAKGKFGFGKDGLHEIKEGVGAGPRTWTGIAPNGDVWTGGPGGEGTNHGSYGTFLPGG